jgi:formate dehydrogenase gamma subunit
MSEQIGNSSQPRPVVQTVRVFERFRRRQRWEHWALLISFTILLLTGLPQKYRTTTWSQQILSTPERLEFVQNLHHIAAILLIVLAIYHLGTAIVHMARRKLSPEMLITWQDFKDAAQMLAYLLFMRKDQPPFGKYNFEQKVTYWFIFFGTLIMIVSGIILWFPEEVTLVLPGGVIPAAKLSHSTEAVVIGIFIIIWHFFHVHLQRLNLSIFNGKMSENDMKKYHALEFERLTGENVDQSGEDKP